VTRSKNFLTPVTRTTLSADICRKLVAHLVRSDWAEGDRIPPERELCQMLGVGRASLREALKALEIMGMIETRLGDGTFVCGRGEFLSRPLLWAITGSSPEDTKQLVEARRCLEVEMAGWAAERATDEELAVIAKHLERMQASASPEEFLEADLSFHLAIGAAAHNAIFMNALHLIRNLMRQWIQRTLGVDGVMEVAVRQHREIFAAIQARDVAAARAAMARHLNDMAQYLLAAQPPAAAESAAQN
jgi:GntR family transcriptional repressor for pyruvate dehydrogenase complex